MSSINTEIANYIQSSFPMNASLFDIFISTKQYSLNAKQKNGEFENLITDGQAVFLIVISNMQKLGIQFSSPGNSQKRNFICWFNSYFAINEPFSYSIQIKEQYFDLAYDMVFQISKESSFVKNIKSKINNFEEYEIEGTDSLTKKGKEFLKSLLN